METPALNYQRIAQAIEFIKENFKDQPDLDRVAAEVNLSPFHFQKLFTEWAGVSPKKFLQYLSVNYAKSVLKTKQATLFDAAYETGLSGTGRLHDMFVNIEAMTPGEFKNDGADLTINYAFHETLFGNALVASTAKGVCRMAFVNEKEDVLQSLKNTYKNATFIEGSDDHHIKALSIF